MKQERTKMNNPQGYGRMSRLLHWLMAAWMIGLLTMGFYMVNLPSGPLRFETLYPIHKISGFFFLFFVIFRLAWRLTHPASPLPRLPIHRFFAKASVPVLYAVMFIMPLSGFVMSHASGHPIAFGRFGTLPALLPQSPQLASWALEVHHMVPYAILFILGMHVLAAFYHHFGLKDTVLRRMIKGGA
jgi:cytochrome b561